MSTPNNRCFICNKKLKLVEQTLGLCKCGHTYCPKHRCVRSNNNQEDCHPCSWDYLKEQQQLLKTQNPNVQASKLTF